MEENDLDRIITDDEDSDVYHAFLVPKCMKQKN